MFAPKRLTTRRRTFTTLLTVLLLLAATAVAYAAFYAINANDADVSEWSAQDVPLFLNDPADDIVATYAGEHQSDIVNSWVATGDDHRLYFLVEMADGTALETNPQDPEPRVIAALLDCDRDGNPHERDDLLIAYGPMDDTVWLLSGDQNQGGALGQGNDDDEADPTLGQRVGNYIEWSVPISRLKFNVPIINWNVDCAENIDIGFATADASFWPFPAGNIDQTVFRGWNVPTAVGLQAFRAAAPDQVTGVAGLIVGLGLLLTAVFFTTRRK